MSGVVYNEMQGALATPDAQLQNALSRAMFPDTAYGFVSGGDPASIPALTYEKYVRVYRRHTVRTTAALPSTVRWTWPRSWPSSTSSI